MRYGACIAMPVITTTATPTTTIHYEERGEGAPIVLIHGWPLSHRMWEGQVNALAAAGHRCIAYDRRGFGESGRPAGGFDYDTFASDLNDLITALDLRDVTLAGFSMGGGEVARYIGRYGTSRVRGAILIGAVTPFMLKTDDNPEGVDGGVFDGMKAGVTSDRTAFLESLRKPLFNWAPGSERRVTMWSRTASRSHGSRRRWARRTASTRSVARTSVGTSRPSTSRRS